MATVQLFFSTIQSMRYVFPDGSEASFVGGRYATADEAKAAHLDYEISKNHPHIRRDASNLSCDESLLDPFEAMKKKIIEDAIAAGIVQRASNSESDAGQVKPAGSDVLVDVKTPEEIILAEQPALTTQTGSDVAIQQPSPVSDDKLAALLASVK